MSRKDQIQGQWDFRDRVEDQYHFVRNSVNDYSDLVDNVVDGVYKGEPEEILEEGRRIKALLEEVDRIFEKANSVEASADDRDLVSELEDLESKYQEVKEDYAVSSYMLNMNISEDFDPLGMNDEFEELGLHSDI